jgi:hypothetical protein
VQELVRSFLRASRRQGARAIAYALLELTDAQMRTTRALDKLGLADASTPFGAIEVMAKELKNSTQTESEAVAAVVEAISQRAPTGD